MLSRPSLLRSVRSLERNTRLPYVALVPHRSIKTLPLFSLENKTCVVTGSARGLGKEFLTAFALSGARGACVDLNEKDCEASITSIASQVQEAYSNDPVPELRAYECNATIESDVKSTWAKIVEDFGKVDVLVTAAGIVDSTFPPCVRSRDERPPRIDSAIRSIEQIRADPTAVKMSKPKTTNSIGGGRC